MMLTAPTSAQGQTAEAEAELRAAAAAFVEAFNDLAWDRFESAWASDATAFFPVPGQVRRVEGRDSIVGTFRTLFAGLPERVDGPPYLAIQPRDLDVHVVSDVAVVTFHLGDPPSLDRRTIIFERRGEAWLIAHLHASSPPGG